MVKKPSLSDQLRKAVDGFEIAPGGDLTEPTCPEWAEMIDNGTSPTCGAAFQLKTIHLDGSAWRTLDSMFDDLLPALGAPDWHGRNFNALVDSIAVGDINDVEPPYVISVTGAAQMAPDVLEFLRDLRAAIQEGLEHGASQGRLPRDARLAIEGDS